MKGLPIQDIHGNFVGRAHIKEEYQDAFLKQIFLITSVVRKEDGKIVGFMIANPPKELFK